MNDFVRARQTMVDCQIRPNDVPDARLTGAFLDTPREAFVPEEQQSQAYLDRHVPLDQTGRRALTTAMVQAKLLRAVSVSEGDKVLVVAAGTGYLAAVLARIAASVVALEEDESLAAKARGVLSGLGNVTVVAGAHTAGAASSGPYDVIVVDGMVEAVPEALFAQLAPDGRLGAVVGRAPLGRATVFTRSHDDIAGRIAFDAVAPFLPEFSPPPGFAFAV